MNRVLPKVLFVGDVTVKARPPDQRKAIIEVKPGMRTLRMPRPMFVPLPYTVFAVAYNVISQSKIVDARGNPIPHDSFMPLRIQVFFRSQPLTSLEDKIFLTPFSNCGYSGDVCLGFGSDSYPTLEECVDAAVTNFWNSSFDNPGSFVTGVGNFDKMRHLTPQAMLDIDWEKYHNSLVDIWRQSYGNDRIWAPNKLRDLSNRWREIL